MILIADSGSTKTHWCIPDCYSVSASSKGRDEKPRLGNYQSTAGKGAGKHFYTQGFNPYVQTSEYINEAMRKELLPQLKGIKKEDISNVYFYGASCSSADNMHIMQVALQEHFPGTTLQIEHDLLAAARALCGKNPGVAAILGTGSNTCLFDGKNILDNIPALGYVMGDEGSGSYMGKKLLRAFLYCEMPNDIFKIFNEDYFLTKNKILEQIYKKPNPNRYLASFSVFISKNIKHPYIENLLLEGFRDFFKTQVSKYDGCRNLGFNCCGSMAFYFSAQLKKVAGEFGMKTGKIIRSPMEGLVEFHS